MVLVSSLAPYSCSVYEFPIRYYTYEQLLYYVLSLQDLEKSLAAQKTLLQQQQEIEAESIELQEFLQAEKSTLADSLRDAETEVRS
jgi:hypothetical protein